MDGSLAEAESVTVPDVSARRRLVSTTLHGARIGCVTAVVLSIGIGLTAAVMALGAANPSNGPLELLLVFFIGGMTVGGIVGGVVGAISGFLFATTDSVRRAPYVMATLGAATVAIGLAIEHQGVSFFDVAITGLVGLVVYYAGTVFSDAVEMDLACDAIDDCAARIWFHSA